MCFIMIKIYVFKEQDNTNDKNYESYLLCTTIENIDLMVLRFRKEFYGTQGHPYDFGYMICICLFHIHIVSVV